MLLLKKMIVNTKSRNWLDEIHQLGNTLAPVFPYISSVLCLWQAVYSLARWVALIHCPPVECTHPALSTPGLIGE